MGPINDRLVGPLSDRLTGLKRALLIVSDAFLQSGLRCVHCPYQRFFIEEDFDHAGTHLNSLLSLSICLDALQNRLSSAGIAITVMAISNLHPGRAWLAQRYLCSQRESDPVLALAAIFMSLRNSIKLKILRGRYMIFLYDNRHQAPLKDCFSAFSNFVHAPLCRLLVLGGAANRLPMLKYVWVYWSGVPTVIYNSFLLFVIPIIIEIILLTRWILHPCLRTGVWLAIGTYFCIGPPICIFAWSGGWSPR